MSKVGAAVREFENVDSLSRQNTGYNRIYPFFKLLITLLYIVCVVSCNNEDITRILSLALYPFLIFLITGLSFKGALYRLRVVLPFVCIMGILNPIFDREMVQISDGIFVSHGLISMIALMIKGVLTVLASYLLAVSTSIDGICASLRRLHIPSIIVTEFMLICRYISVLGREADRMWMSYSLRAPNQKGIAFKSWGPMIGGLLIRSMDRAEVVYQSMYCRGFDENYIFASRTKIKISDWVYLLITAFLILVFRIIPIMELIGSLFV